MRAVLYRMKERTGWFGVKYGELKMLEDLESHEPDVPSISPAWEESVVHLFICFHSIPLKFLHLSIHLFGVISCFHVRIHSGIKRVHSIPCSIPFLCPFLHCPWSKTILFSIRIMCSTYQDCLANPGRKIIVPVSWHCPWQIQRVFGKRFWLGGQVYIIGLASPQKIFTTPPYAEGLPIIKGRTSYTAGIRTHVF